MKKNKILASLLFLLTPLLGFAHPGHGHTDPYTLTHYFVEPEHFVVLLGILVAGIVYFSYLRKNDSETENI